MSMNHPIVDRIERTGYPRYPYATPQKVERKTCERLGCEEKAIVSIRGTLHCAECAEYDEGVKLL